MVSIQERDMMARVRYIKLKPSVVKICITKSVRNKLQILTSNLRMSMTIVSVSVTVHLYFHCLLFLPDNLKKEKIQIAKNVIFVIK